MQWLDSGKCGCVHYMGLYDNEKRLTSRFKDEKKETDDTQRDT